MSVLWSLASIRTPFLDQVFQLATYLGQELFLIAVVCALYWCRDKQLALRIGLNYVCAGLLVQSLKITFRVPRPWDLDPDFSAVPSAVPAATGYSFPSGHTQAAGSLFFPLALVACRWHERLLCAAAALLVGFSRMYLGCHTPQDVGAALGLSLAFALLIHRFREALLDHRHVGRTALFCAVLAVFVCGYSYLLFSRGVIEARYVSDCFKAAGASFGFGVGWYLERRRLDFSPAGIGLKKGLLRLLLGLGITAALHLALGLLLGGTLAGETLRHALLLFWIIYLYPCIFTKFHL